MTQAVHLLFTAPRIASTIPEVEKRRMTNSRPEQHSGTMLQRNTKSREKGGHERGRGYRKEGEKEDS